MAKKNDIENLELKGQEVDLVDFDTWWASVEDSIPGHHYKEIVVADFRGRGVSMRESIETFQQALKKYGVKLA